MWHASVAFRRTSGPDAGLLTVSAWGSSLFGHARTAGLALVRGVGDRPIYVHTTRSTLHVRRALLEGEAAELRSSCPAFFASPPVDPGGTGDLLETIE